MTKSKNSKSIAKDSLTLSVVKVATLAIGMITTMLLSRQRTLQEYGTYSQIKMVVTLATSIFSAGLTSSINYFVGRSEEESELRQFTKTYFSAITILSLLCGLVLTISNPIFIKVFNNEDIKDFLYILFLLPTINLVAGSVDNYLISQKRYKMLYAYQIVQNSVVLIIATITYVANFSLSQYLLLLTAENIVVVITVYILVANVSGTIPLGMDISLMKKILTYSIPIGLAGVVGTLSIETDKLLIATFTDTEMYAVYENVSRELPFSIIVASVSSIMIPQLARMIKQKQMKAAFSLWRTASELCFTIMSLISIMLIVFAEPIIKLLYSEKYLPGITIFRIYSLVTMVKFTYYGMMLNSTGKTKFILYSSIISLVLNLGLNYALFYLFGINGPAIATVLSICIIGYAQLKYSCKIGGIDIRQLFPWGRMLKSVIINSILGVLAYVLFYSLKDSVNIPELIIAIIIGAVCCIIALFIQRKKIMSAWYTLNE